MIDSLFDGQKLIYSRFIDKISTVGDGFSTPKQVTPEDEILDFGINEMFKGKEESPRNIMPDLETEESAAERRKHEVHGLKILPPQQMLSRLQISLAQLKAENNSQKIKNVIRQLLYSLYRSKKLSKRIYKHLMNTII